MNLALRLAMACFVIAAPTLLYLGLLRGLEKLRDDALLMRLAESDDASQDVSAMAARTVEERPARADGRGNASAGRSAGAGRNAGAGKSAGAGGAGASASADASTNTGTSTNAGASTRPNAGERPPESVACGTCGASNMLGAKYCGECLDELDW